MEETAKYELGKGKQGIEWIQLEVYFIMTYRVNS